jgi:uncharacterized protein (DUF1810 family)
MLKGSSVRRVYFHHNTIAFKNGEWVWGTTTGSGERFQIKKPTVAEILEDIYQYRAAREELDTVREVDKLHFFQHKLSRFVVAQESTYEGAIKELRAGRKTGHWIWWVFPQLKGLGHSYNSEYYGISGLDEAKAYWAHPVLGARLREALEALQSTGKPPEQIMGSLDAMKLQSCLSLFSKATGDPLFDR